MAALERFRNDSLDRQEQAAFSELADTLIFQIPMGFKLSRQSINELSHEVQDQFLDQERGHEQKKLDWIEGAMKQLEKTADDLARMTGRQREPETTKRSPEIRPLIQEDDSETGIFLKTTGSYLVGKGLDDSTPYNAWGFTPKLAGEPIEDTGFTFARSGSNCFGCVQALGGLYRAMGLKPEMGITADHPFAIVEVEGKTYLSSLFGVNEAKGIFEQHDGYKTYTPSPEDKIPYKLMTVWNFDEALVYELLENFEVLRQMSLGNKVENLPGTEESGMKLAEQHRGTLQGASWRKIQEKVAPQLANYFHDHEREWAAELERVGIGREVKNFFKEVMEAGQAATSMNKLSFDDFKKEFLPVAKAHGQSIVSLIVSGVESGPDIPGDVVLFAQRAKAVLDAIPIPELRAEVTQSFLRPFIAKEESLTEE